LTEQEARDRGRDVRIATIPMTYVTRAVEMGETRGFMKAVVDSLTDQILGCAVLGIEGARSWR
jgi:pyruvate/2-oxoglutarate dehydrogenase complex dihydrolipoamide dehydrogenase (E3) component